MQGCIREKDKDKKAHTNLRQGEKHEYKEREWCMSMVNPTRDDEKHSLPKGTKGVGVSMADEGGQNHTLPVDKEAKAGVSMVNKDKGGRNHTLSRDKEAKRGVTTMIVEDGGQNHTPTRNKGTKGSIKDRGMMNSDEEGQKHAPTRDKDKTHRSICR
ncbi:uncharacterized protein LACBIDRAFT_329428 [Laccaria bicolor S238N-H82]|uniref:Predicted protein n=1 Tax=Laccaria bicolor (strain S238N-H82 / ATCC MYA-4686) TaxID=486041 RepID=B0DHZ6_LACBS|nr:uncharacterized protein LACBIDRAFT_329428 [Laccaria bicolor S238N-H82]EDR05919.1 predicted protein [Laccaria bicolor S238N-H82]|eukprot:XP_001883595.1 predicted protein [Laccaria bicolor S238N-H82]